MILKPSPVSTRHFTNVPAENVLVAEMSDLGVPFGRVFDDACDEGLTLVSHRTGREVVYAIQEEKRDAEGDLLYWELAPVGTGPTFRPPNVRIFND